MTTKEIDVLEPASRKRPDREAIAEAYEFGGCDQCHGPGDWGGVTRFGASNVCLFGCRACRIFWVYQVWRWRDYGRKWRKKEEALANELKTGWREGKGDGIPLFVQRLRSGATPHDPGNGQGLCAS